MSLHEQVLLILFSLLFGIIFSLVLNVNYKYIIRLHKGMQIFTTFILVFNFSMIYFLMIKKINHAIFHPYSLLCIFIGSLIEIYFTKRIKNK